VGKCHNVYNITLFYCRQYSVIPGGSRLEEEVLEGGMISPLVLRKLIISAQHQGSKGGVNWHQLAFSGAHDRLLACHGGSGELPHPGKRLTGCKD
jgi:hypothetical protein